MEYVLLIISFVLIIGGLVGSFLPVLPGPSLSWLGLLALYFTDDIEFNYWILAITFIITLAITILDYVIPAQGTKRFGGSKYGVWGTNIGLIIGILFPIPFGFILGPFVGVFIGELIYKRDDSKRALKAATGSFIGFLASTFMKFVVCMAFLGFYIKEVIVNWNIWF